MIFFKWIWGKKKPAPVVTENLPPDGKYDLITRCPNCGYEGDESEFLTENQGDTICPKCGEDTPIYEL